MLRPVALTGYYNPGWNMCDADRAISRINVLSTSALRAMCIYPQIFFLHLDINVVIYFRISPD